MRPLYKNQIFDYLKATKYGIEGFDFQPSHGPHNVPDRIVFKTEPKLAFYIRCGEFDNNTFEFAYNAYAPEFPFVGYQARGLNIQIILIALGTWLNAHVGNYVLDQETPDRWSDYSKINLIGFLLTTDYGEQTYFAPDEKQQFLSAIDRIEQRLIAELSLTQDQIGEVHKSINYLKVQMSGADKLAMKFFSIGTFINLIFVLTLDTERGNKLFQIIREIFSSLAFLPGY